jgi:hypothetical protein
MKTLAVLFVISLFFLAGGCSENSSPLSPLDDNTSLSKVPVPFNVKIEGFNTVYPTSPTSGSSVFELSGTGTHVGKFTAFGTGPYVLTGPTTGVASNGVLTMNSASGEEIYMVYNGSWVINAEGLYEYSITLEFTGGTGRFEGITGEVTSLVIGTNVEPGNPLYKTVTGGGEGWILFQ